MRCSTTQHKTYGGMDRPARRLDVGLLSQDGASLLQRNMHTRPERFLKALAPSRAELGVAVAWRFPWTWRADLCARAAMPFLLGHALSRTAMHGGQATNDTLDAQTMAVGLRGGRWPQASVSPAERRATRALLRRRRPLSRTRPGRTPARSAGKSAPTPPTALAAPSGCLLLPGRKVWQSPAP